MIPVCVDLETFWSQDHTLTKLNPIVYCTHKDTELLSLAFKFADDPAHCVVGESAIKAWAASVDWSDKFVYGHNLSLFDSMILRWRLGIRPKMWGCTLAMSRPIHGLTVGGSLAELVKHYGIGIKNQSAILNTKGRHLNEFTFEEVEALKQYNITDVEQCAALFKILLPQTPKKELQIIDMTIRMLVEPKFRVDIDLLESTLAQERERKTRMLFDLAAAMGLPTTGVSVDDVADEVLKTLRSAEKFAKLLKDLNVDPPMKPSPSNPEKQTYAFSKTDEQFLALLDHDNALVSMAAAARLGAKSTILETRIESFLQVAAATGGRMPIAKTYHGAHCVPGDTEVLTPSGWVRIDEWGGGDIVQCDTQQQLVFAPATRYDGPEITEWVRCTSPYLNCDFTLGHRVPWLSTGKTVWKESPAADMVTRGNVRVPTAGMLSAQGAITPEQMRVLVMVQADGSYELSASVGRRLTVFVKKPRKIERARALFSAAGVSFTEQTYNSHPGFVRFIVRWADLPEWLTPNRKRFGAWLLDSTNAAREAFINEVVLWDGSVGADGRLNYYSSEKENAEWVATIGHITGVSCSISAKGATGNRRETYTVTLHRRSPMRRSLKAGAFTAVITEPRKAFCPKTVTGYWLARSNGNIFITGNTGRFSGAFKLNQENLPRIESTPRLSDALRKSLIAPAGHKVVVADLSGIELRINHFLWKVQSSMALFNASPDKADLYKDFAAKLYGVPVDQVTEQQRQIGKVAHLGLGFGAGAKTFVRIAKMMGGVSITDEEAASIVRSWRDSYLEIVSGWKRCQSALASILVGAEQQIDDWGLTRTSKDGIILPSGRVLRYPGIRKTEDGSWKCGDGKNEKYLTGGKVDENIVQALARDVLTDAALEIRKTTGYYPVHTVHDELIYIMPESDADAMLDTVQGVLRSPPKWWPELVTWSKGDVGQSYGDAK